MVPDSGRGFSRWRNLTYYQQTIIFFGGLLSTGCGYMPSLCQFSEGFHVVNIAVNLVHRFQFSYLTVKTKGLF